ncbi:hypothetical protein ALNOE001_01280 [Candidatus Methanobinarius endosymbioticus]|uniref:Uncharacterized protein n=1 Tax=Candidatus Methanobinarius endosymbioticus TaxID=2006182 RepID=A0A366ME00_9EURY|nr:hypothetical protein ALNOE001_01280 [Candidatus Methanobinarius endosymbioticus]
MSQGVTIFNRGYYFSVVNSTFIGSNASIGGAIYSTGSSINLIAINSTFIGSSASIGGAIYSTAYSNVNTSTFNNNNARNYGDAIYNSGRMSLVGNKMLGNSAGTNGPMIYNDGAMGILNLSYLDNVTVYVGSISSIILYATLTDDMDNTVSGQNISFYINGTLIGSLVSDRNRKANITFHNT